MKKLFLNIIFVMFVIVSLVACSNDTNNVNEKKDKFIACNIFTQEEIDGAINCVKNSFQEEPFNKYVLNDVWYDEENSNITIESYLDIGKGKENGVKAENVIVISSEFFVGDVNDGPLEPNTTYDIDWILIRGDKKEQWRVDDCGV